MVYGIILRIYDPSRFYFNSHFPKPIILKSAHMKQLSLPRLYVSSTLIFCLLLISFWSSAQTPTWQVQSDYFGERNLIAQPRTIRAVALSSNESSIYTGLIQSPNTGSTSLRKVKSQILATPGTDHVIFGNGMPGGGCCGFNQVGGQPVYAGGGTGTFEAWRDVDNSPEGIDVDDRGNVFVALQSGVSGANRVDIFNSNLTAVVGSISVSAPTGVHIYKSGANYFAYVVSSAGLQRWNVNNVAAPVLDGSYTPGVFGCRSLTVDSDGTVFAVGVGANQVFRVSSAGAVTHTTTVLNAAGVAVFRDNIYIIKRQSPTQPIVVLKKANLTSAGPDLIVPAFGATRGDISQFTSIDVTTDGRLFVSEENYTGITSGSNSGSVLSYTPPATTFNPVPGTITGRIYFDRVLVSSSLILPVHNLNQNTFYLTIQAGVNAANPNDVLECEPWTFNERVVIDRSLTIQGMDKNTCIVDGTGLAGAGSGFSINAGVTNVTIKNLTIKNFAGAGPNSYAGIYAIGGNDNLTVTNNIIKDNVGGCGFYANGPVNTVMIDGNTISGHSNAFGAARGIVIWNGLKQNITITNNEVFNNNCCGIELQDGSGTGVLVGNNNVHDNGDNGIGLVGLQGPGSNLVSANTVANNGRFGIEIKNPNGNGASSGPGSVVITNNTVSRTTAIGDARDIAGIAIFRRGVTAGNVDVPRGTYVSANAVSGYTQPSTSDGFGIVMEGINHSVNGNTINGNDVGIQRQAGHLPYPGDGDQNNLADTYFGRGNSPVTCGVTLTGNVFGNITANGVNTRDVGNSSGTGIVTNINTGESFCTIQAAINAPNTINGHTIQISSGTYNEQVLVNKSVTLVGIGMTQPTVDFTGTVSGKPTSFDVSADNVTIDNIHFNVDLSKLRSAIIATSPGLDNIVVKNNIIDAYGSPAGSYGERNAVSINYAGYRIATGGVNSVTYTNNRVNGSGLTSYFRSAISADEVGGLFSGNTAQTINHDILVRFGSNGPVTVTNNICNGGGIELDDMNAAAGLQTISGNTFNAAFAQVSAPGTAVLRMRDNFNSKQTLIQNNSFFDVFWGISLENYNAVTISENSFTPTANSTNFHHITVNTKVISSSSSSAQQVVVDANIRNNTFNGSGVNGGSAITFMNHDDNNASFGTFDVHENSFDLSIANDIEQDNQSGPSSGSPFPNYNLLIGGGAGTLTNMSPWTAPINGTCNWYGTTTSATIAGKVGPNVTYAPFLSSGTDTDMGTNGFQPAANTCNNPIPVLTSTLNGVTLTNNYDGNPETATMTICNTTNNVHQTGIMDIANVMPANQVKIKQESVRTNVNFNGAADGVYVASSLGGTFDRTVSLINPAMSGQFILKRTIFFDVNNNNILDANDFSNDAIIYTINVDGEAPVITVPADATAECNTIPPVGIAGVSDDLDQMPTVTYQGETTTPGTLKTAYTSSITNGNQEYQERLGMVFTATAPVTITHLGAFDDGQNGLSRPITVGIVRNSDGATVVGPITMSGTNDVLVGKYRMRGILPVTLPAGQYIIVAVGYGPGEANGNANIGGPATTFDGSGGLLTSDSSPYGGAGFGKPTTPFPTPSIFHAGTFRYAAPANCPGKYIITRTWNATDDCGNSSTNSQTIQVSDNTAPSIATCPADKLVTGCSTAAITSLTFSTNPTSATAMQFSDEGGSASDQCSNINYSYQDVANGTCPIVVTRTWTVKDDCGNTSICQQTITIKSPSVTLQAPADHTAGQCKTQADIQSEYDNWLMSVVSGGGCNLLVTNDAPANAPSHCGGSVTVTWTATSDCEPPYMRSATFNVPNAPGVTLQAPADHVTGQCKSQFDIQSEYDNWLMGVVYSGGCNLIVTNNAPSTAPSHCGGSVTVTWTATSDCEPPYMRSATFTVPNAPGVTLQAPADHVTGQCKSQFDIQSEYDNWLMGVVYSGGCNLIVTNNAPSTAPSHCGGSVTVTWTANSDCEAPYMRSATFTVPNAPGVTLQAPADHTTGQCKSQADIQSEYDNWLMGVVYSGGCNLIVTNNAPTNAPSHCGGSHTVTWTATSDCEAPYMRSATFTVPNAPGVTLQAPADHITGQCKTQADIQSEYDNWLMGVVYSGGCNLIVTNDAPANAPSHCGGSHTVTWTANSDCEGSYTRSATFTVPNAPGVTLQAPADYTATSCQTQTAIQSAYDSWLMSVVYGGGCNLNVTNNAPSIAPPRCGGSVTVTWTANSDCELQYQRSSTFTVTAAPILTITCPNNRTATSCQSQADINSAFAAWKAAFKFMGGCGTTATDLSGYNAPPACGGSVTITYTASDNCNQTQSCTKTFTVQQAPTLTISCPNDKVENSCQTQAVIDASFTAWKNSFSYSGGCGTTATDISGIAAPLACGGSVTINYSATDVCGQSQTCSKTFTVTGAPVLTISCPNNRTATSCQSQADINSVFAAWKAAFKYMGGCGTTATDLTNYSAPPACGGSVSITYTASDNCGQTQSCTKTFTVQQAPTLTISCPNDKVENSCQTQVAIDMSFAAWKNSFSYSGGCGTTATDISNVSAPLACGGTVSITYTATDVCGQSQMCTKTFTVTAAPTLTISCPNSTTAPACQSQSDINSAFAAWKGSFSYNGGCGTTATNLSGYNAPLACGGSVTITYSASDNCGQTQSSTKTFTVQQAPTLTISCPNNRVENSCQSQTAINTAFATWKGSFGYMGGCGTTASDLSGYNAPPACGGSVTITYTATDVCGQSQTCTKTFTVTADNTPPSITCQVNQTRPTNPGLCTYTTSGMEFDLASKTDNCAIATVTYLLTGATTGSGSNTLNGIAFNRGTTTVKWTVTDNCGNASDCSFNVVITDNQNPTSYIIYATTEAKFGEDNFINGDVGVTDAKGKAEFKKGDDLYNNYVRAKNINVQLPSHIVNRDYNPATGGPVIPPMPYSGNTSGLGNFTVTVNNSVVASNYKNLTIKKGLTATVTGNNYGKITIEEGANVTFTSSVINMEELSVGKGKKGVALTTVKFDNPTSVKVRDRVTIEEDCRINICGPKVTFYVSDTKKDEENFTVKGDDTWVTANVVIPNGKLKITGGTDNCTMTGWYVVEKMESDGKNITWNPYTCTPCFSSLRSPAYVNTPVINQTPAVDEVAKPATFEVKVYPNPSSTDFTIRVVSSSDAPIQLRMLDISGHVLNVNNTVLKGATYKLGSELRGGTYFAEITQGDNKQVIKLVKLN